MSARISQSGDFAGRVGLFLKKEGSALSRRAFLRLACAIPLTARFASAAAFSPDRHWDVFVLNDSHLDIGWHALPDVIRARIANYTDDAVELCDASRDKPPAQQYKFTLEHSWVVSYYEQHRPPAQFARLVDCIRRGQIEVGALYTSVHTDLCGHEELVRLTSLAGDLRRRLRVPLDVAILNDVSESYTMGLAQVLAKSGIKYFCMGPGAKANTRGIVPRVPRIFRWTAKDGSSVIVAWTPGIWTYARWSAAGYKGDITLEEFQQLPDYPYDVIFRHGGEGDISSPDPKMLDLVREYQQESPEATISLSTASEFFRVLSARYQGEVESRLGDVADSWADGVISLARETGIQRRTQSALIRAEILANMAGLDCKVRVREAYNNLQLYSDHTWGFDFEPDNKPGLIRKFSRAIGGGQRKQIEVPSGQVLTPGSPEMEDYEAAWNAKKQYAYNARDAAFSIMSEAQENLAGRVATLEPCVIVWNTLSWSRSGLAAFTVPDGRTVTGIRDQRTGKSKPVQQDHWGTEIRSVFLAEDIPAFGYAVYAVQFGSAPPVDIKSANELENSRYKIQLNPESASVSSIYDRHLNRYIHDGSADYAVGQYIYDNVNDCYVGSGGGGTNKSGFAYGAGERSVPVPDGGPSVQLGPVYSSIEWKAKLNGGPAPAQVSTRIVLVPELPHISLQSLVSKKAAMEKEQIYFAFPFDIGTSPKFVMELAYCALDWDHDIMPGSWRGYSAIRNFVRLMGKDAGITWASLDAPVVSVGGINSNRWDPRWHDSYKPEHAHIYSYIMSNIWNCNYPLYQGGETRFDYAFMSHDCAFTRADSFRFGWEMNHPLETRFCAGSKEVTKNLPPTIVRAVEPNNVVVSTIKSAEDSREIVLRVFETAGIADTIATVHVGEQFKTARLMSLTEEDLGPAILRNGVIELVLHPNELVTVGLTA